MKQPHLFYQGPTSVAPGVDVRRPRHTHSRLSPNGDCAAWQSCFMRVSRRRIGTWAVEQWCPVIVETGLPMACFGRTGRVRVVGRERSTKGLGSRRRMVRSGAVGGRRIGDGQALIRDDSSLGGKRGNYETSVQ